MPQLTPITDQAINPGQIVALDTRKQEQVVSDKQYLKILQLSDLLSRHLDVADILRLFSNEISALVRHNSYRFVSNDLLEPVRHGALASHCLNYHLTIQSMNLGELSIYRDQPFSANEVCQVEDLLCALIYPLRNALMYQSALLSAHRDPLTGINNRAALDRLMPREISLAKRHDHRMAMIVMDLDGFKAINDQCGHDTGDHVLRLASSAVHTSLRESDMLFRYGGDEFVAALPHTDIQGAIDVANRILVAVNSLELESCADDTGFGISIGLSMLASGDDFEGLFKRVDQALYRAKQNGKNQVVVA